MAHHFTPLCEAFLPPKQTIVPIPGKVGMVEQLPPPTIIWIDEVASTHNLLKSALADPESLREALGEIRLPLPPLTMIAARRQTAGRGQRGNHWESEDFKNLTFSVMAYPSDVPPACQFAISEATALAIVALLQAEGIDAMVKWPNDIYVADRKICGILIDHALQGAHIRSSIISAGLNVNQKHFLSDAPNPVAMTQLTGRQHDIERLAQDFLLLLRQFLPLAASAGGRETLHASYMRRLYRHDGRKHRFFDVAKKEEIMAEITEVGPEGLLTLKLDDKSTRTYAFKEVIFLH